MRQPWYAWLILALAVVFISGLFFFVFGTVPKVGTWLRYVAAALPVLISLPFIIGNLRRK
jgi:hypothetical protein